MSAVRYEVPLGESGTGSVPAGGVSNSRIRVYNFERQHLAGQRLRLRVQAQGREGGDLFRVAAQRVRLRTVLDEANRPIAYGAETVTHAVGPDGDTTILREFAMLAGRTHPLRANPSAFFGEGRRSIPQFTLFDAYLSRLRIEQDSRFLRETLRPEPIEQLQGSRSHVFENARRAVLDLVRGLEGLRSAVQGLLVEGTFRGVSVRSDAEDRVGASFTNGPELADHDVRVVSLARAHEIAGDAVVDPGAALGLKGTFRIGQEEVIVREEDSLFDLVVRINRGEDANGNGRLDNAEDRNHNLVLDPYEDANGNGRLDTEEDLNDNGIFDPATEDLNRNGRFDRSEDLNFNFELDGGTDVHGVRARLVDNRPLLSRAEPGETPIRLEDPDGILASLGIVTTNVLGETVPKEERTAPARADVSVDGESHAPDGNRLEGGVEGLAFDLRNVGAASIRVAADREPPAAGIRGFVEAFNAVIVTANRFLLPDGALDRDSAAARARLGLDRELGEGVPRAGLDPVRDARARFHELQVAEAARRLRGRLAGFLDRAEAPPSATNGLDRIGILGDDYGRIELDEDRLREGLETDLDSVREAFTGEAGLATRLERFLGDLLDAPAGELPIRDRVLAGGRPDAFARAVEESLSTRNESSIRLGLLETIA